jgi:DNA-directed RNA polymerase subunit RPC12/RpoP
MQRSTERFSFKFKHSFKIKLSHAAALAVFSLLGAPKPSHATIPNRAIIAVAFDKEWFERRSAESATFKQAATQVLSDAQTFEKIRQQPLKPSRPSPNQNYASILLSTGILSTGILSTGIAIATSCILGHHPSLQTSLQTSFKPIAATFLGASLGISVIAPMKTLYEWIRRPLHVLSLTPEEEKLLANFSQLAPDALPSLVKNMLHFFSLLTEEEQAQLYWLPTSTILLDLQRIESAAQTQRFPFQNLTVGPITPVSRRKHLIDEAERLSHLKVLETTYEFLKECYQKLPHETEYSVLRNLLLDEIHHLPTSAQYGQSDLILIARIKSGLNEKLIHETSVEDFAHEKQDSEFIQAVSDFKKTLSINAQLHLPSQYSQDYSCPICQNTFEIADRITIACNHCSSGLLHTECLRKWQNYPRNRGARAADSCIVCAQTYGIQRRYWLGEKI